MLSVDPRSFTIRQLVIMHAGSFKSSWDHTASLMAWMHNLKVKQADQISPTELHPLTHEPETVEFSDKEVTELFKGWL